MLRHVRNSLPSSISRDGVRGKIERAEKTISFNLGYSRSISGNGTMPQQHAALVYDS